MEYRRTRDILYVKHMLGHKRLENTEIYTHLVEYENWDAFHAATATTIDEAKKRVEAGFECICDMQDLVLFRRRK